MNARLSGHLHRGGFASFLAVVLLVVVIASMGVAYCLRANGQFLRGHDHVQAREVPSEAGSVQAFMSCLLPVAALFGGVSPVRPGTIGGAAKGDPSAPSHVQGDDSPGIRFRTSESS